MLEWTGERFLPWMRDPLLAYEHLHRYIYAIQFASGKRVLDLAAGEGYGSSLLAKTAQTVVGVDIDDRAIRHATEKYASSNLRFVRGTIAGVPIHDDHSFDLVVCFEAIEHIEEHDRFLSEVKRLLTPEGLFIVSTPDKPAYRREFPEVNAHHVKELSSGEFQCLIAKYFRNSRFFGQRVYLQSNIWPFESSGQPIQEFVMKRGREEFELIPNNQREPLYAIAFASDAALPVGDTGSVLVDESNELLKERNRAIEELNNRLAGELAAIQASSSWQIVLKLRRLRGNWLPEGSSRRRVFNRLLGIGK
jgi:ubiquinone/menaquinone biosynthesis C-methylase UbiE